MLRLPLLASGSALALAAAALLFVMRPGEAVLPAVATRSATKGGELAVSLVREHQGSTAVDPAVFVSGDRFEVQLTCPSQGPVRWDLLVFQSGQVFFPLRPEAALDCGNHVTLPGAFKLTGQDLARVCVVVQSKGAVDRARIARALPESSVCVEVSPAR